VVVKVELPEDIQDLEMEFQQKDIKHDQKRINLIYILSKDVRNNI